MARRPRPTPVRLRLEGQSCLSLGSARDDEGGQMAKATWAQQQREIERQRAAHERAARQREHDRIAQERARARAVAADEKERKRLYLAARAKEADELNQELAETVRGLEGLLRQTLTVDDLVDFDALKIHIDLPPFAAGDLATPTPVPQLTLPPSPAGLAKLVPGAKAKHTEGVRLAEEQHDRQLRQHADSEAARKKALSHRTQRYDELLARGRREQEQQHAEVDVFRASYEAGEPGAIVNYCSRVLAASQYPDLGFPRDHKVAWDPDSRQLVVEFSLPTAAVIPDVREYRYVKSKDEIATSARTAAQSKALYASVIAQLALRTVHELFEADRGSFIDTIALNAHVDTIDRRTGHPVRPCLLTLRTTRDAFAQLDLSQVEPQACLRGLNAGVSKSPTELLAVRPVLEFNMVDSRFVEETDVLGSIDQRPNLMELTPSEFESLITNLFEKMGLQTRLTQASRDGGVDCVAYDPRPIFGGKVVIQAKRYKNTVGVSAVRDLYGTMQNEGASKGILVTTSGYGKASFAFAENKPLELLSGSNLLYLLQEHAELEARIEPPESWVDPVPDAEDAVS